MRFCQSCGMPLTDEVLGTNADGSKSEEYCIYCYKDGAFTGIKDMPKITNLFVLQGSFVNMEYQINGNTVKFLDDSASYWGTQVERLRVGEQSSGMKGDGRCFGIACDEHYILVSEYGKDGADAKLVVLKNRD